jgi:hypothetical protein
MFRYKLRTLMIVLALGPPVLAAAWCFWHLFWLPWREFDRLLLG